MLQWRNRLARRTYKQYMCSFLSNAEVVSSSLTWSIRFQVCILSLIIGAFTSVFVGLPTGNEMSDWPPVLSPSPLPICIAVFLYTPTRKLTRSVCVVFQSTAYIQLCFTHTLMHTPTRKLLAVCVCVCVVFKSTVYIYIVYSCDLLTAMHSHTD